jgi:hypothetical protein
MEYKGRHNLARSWAVALLFLCPCLFAYKVPPVLAPSTQSLIRQNVYANRDRMRRFKNQDEVQDAVSHGELIALPDNQRLHVATTLPRSRRYALPITVQFLLTLSDAYRLQFGSALTVDSAVRPRNVQESLRHHNKSAAPTYGPTASSHETGATIDLSRHMSKKQTQWLEQQLLVYTYLGYAVVEEERHCFHIFVSTEAALL